MSYQFSFDDFTGGHSMYARCSSRCTDWNNFFVSLYRADMHLKSIYVNATFEKTIRTRNSEYFFHFTLLFFKTSFDSCAFYAVNKTMLFKPCLYGNKQKIAKACIDFEIQHLNWVHWNNCRLLEIYYTTRVHLDLNRAASSKFLVSRIRKADRKRERNYSSHIIIINLYCSK